MGKGKGTRQKALKGLGGSKLEREQARPMGLSSALRQIRQARAYSIEGCWVRHDWQETGLAVVLVARRQPDGNILFGNYLVDYYCLGLKDTFCNANVPPEQFRREVMHKIFPKRPLSISPALAHEIIYGGIEYAAQFGFRPQRDFKDSQYVLDPPDMHPRSGKVKFGYEGKPLFVAGPYDDVNAIVNQLRRTAGEGNFNYMIGMGAPPFED
jgi:hypothetical protein